MYMSVTDNALWGLLFGDSQVAVVAVTPKWSVVQVASLPITVR